MKKSQLHHTAFSRDKTSAAFAALLVFGSLCFVSDTARTALPNISLRLSSFSAEPLLDAVYAIAYAGIILAATLRIGAWLGATRWDEMLGIGATTIAIAIPISTIFFPLNATAFKLLLSLLAISFVPMLLPTRLRTILDKGVTCAPPPSMRYLSWIVFACIAWTLLSTFVIPSGMDALTYHLNLGLQYLMKGDLRPDPNNIYYHYMQNGELFLMLGTVFDRSGTTSNITVALFFIGAIASATRSGRTLGSLLSLNESGISASGVIAAAGIAASTICMILTSHTKTDIIALALVASAFAAVLDGRSAAFRAAFLLGGAIGVKVTSGYAVLPLVVVLLHRERASRARFIGVIALFTIPFLWWILSNVHYLGAPLPHGGSVPSSILAVFGPALFMRLARIIGASLLFIPEGMDGPFGALFLAGLAALVPHVRRSSPLAMPARASLFAIGLWFVTGGGSHEYASGGLLRFVLPMLGICAPSAGAAFALLAESSSARFARAFTAALAFAAAAGLAAAVIVSFASQPSLLRLAGILSEERYMDNWHSSHRVIRESSRMLPNDAVVLSVGENRLFHLGRRAYFDADKDRPLPLLVLHMMQHDSTRFDAWLRSTGVTHILYTPLWLDYKMKIGLTEPLACPLDRAAFERYLASFARSTVTDTERMVFMYARLGNAQ